jgi:hypothetical protein
VALLQERADGRAADPFLSLGDVRDVVHLKALLASQAAQPGQVALAFSAQRKVGPDPHFAHPHAFAQALYKGTGRQARQNEIKVQDDQDVQPQGLGQIALFGRRGQIVKRLLWVQDGGGVRVKGDQGRDTACVPGPVDQFGDQVLVADVNAVERADGQDGLGAGQWRGQGELVDVGEQCVHRQPSG